MIADDVTPLTAADDAARQDTMISNVMLATGLSREAVVELMITDDELDRLCDAALAVGRPNAWHRNPLFRGQ
ncbi:hypothetical protein [Beijerinckia sp. L45]|uniref:hypothetical protein n=1 Tax=Beijerinckia sp. L45 TaxID=1641855 RepID=UPI00131AE8C8|nr:hypothetical protein [Beijerinckia sp. L45]